MRVPADIYLINYESMHWWVAQVEQYYVNRGKYPPVSWIVYDEVTRIKNSSSRVNTTTKRILGYLHRRTGLTGTPSPNGYPDLFGQYLMVDQGVRLGQDLGSYRARFLRQEGISGTSRYVVRKGCDDEIHSLISDITMEMSSRDYLDLPEIITNKIRLKLPPKLQAQYDTLEKEMFVELDNQEKLEVFAAIALSTKVRQFANGASYVVPKDPRWVHIHDIKLGAFEEIVEEAGGKPVLVAYQFKHDGERIAKRWPGTRFVNSKMKASEMTQTIIDWNADLIPILCGHPMSMGHGLNLQHSSCQDVVLFGPDWSPEMEEQVVGRVMRQGQRNNIRVHHILMDNTADNLVEKVVQMKATTEMDLKTAVREYRKIRGI
jgi:SNF2 family DNA or RNA helicase